MTEAQSGEVQRVEKQSPVTVHSFEDLVDQISSGNYLSLPQEHLNEINMGDGLEDWIQHIDYDPTKGPEIHAYLIKNGRHTYVDSKTAVSVEGEEGELRASQQILGLAVLEAKLRLLENTLRDVAPQVTQVGFRVPLAYRKIDWAKDEILKGRLLDTKDASANIPEYSPGRRAVVRMLTAAVPALILAACRTPDGTPIATTEAPQTPNMPQTQESTPAVQPSQTPVFPEYGTGGQYSQEELNSTGYKNAALFADACERGGAGNLAIDSSTKEDGTKVYFVRLINVDNPNTETGQVESAILAVPRDITEYDVNTTKGYATLLQELAEGKRKALYLTPGIIPNGTVDYDANTDTFYRFDANGNKVEQLPPGALNWEQYSAGQPTEGPEPTEQPMEQTIVLDPEVQSGYPYFKEAGFNPDYNVDGKNAEQAWDSIEQTVFGWAGTPDANGLVRGADPNKGIVIHIVAYPLPPGTTGYMSYQKMAATGEPMYGYKNEVVDQQLHVYVFQAKQDYQAGVPMGTIYAIPLSAALVHFAEFGETTGATFDTVMPGSFTFDERQKQLRDVIDRNVDGEHTRLLTLVVGAP